jgi:hypothetical protein
MIILLIVSLLIVLKLISGVYAPSLESLQDKHNSHPRECAHLYRIVFKDRALLSLLYEAISWSRVYGLYRGIPDSRRKALKITTWFVIQK